MRALWITNTLFPDVCAALNIDKPVLGGWMYAGAQSLLTNVPEITLAVAAIYSGKEMQKMEIGGITYYLLPSQNNTNYDAKLESYWKQVAEDFSPEVVHIHGTEYVHGLAYIKACGSKNVVVSIQGLVSVYERYYYGGISEANVRKNITLRDVIRGDSMIDQRDRMKSRGVFEKQTIQSVDNVIGRTAWDKAHVLALNPNIEYHFCNETVRSEFYKYQWSFEKCEKCSIFLSQAHYPIKGLQQIIAALPFVLEHYPQTKVYVAGSNFINKSYLRQNGFGKLIQSQIDELGLQNHINFVGVLTETQMCHRYLRSNVFVCPSSIENSPNSVGEAQLLGVPCIGSFVGGMSDMIEDEETGLLYRFEEVEMLAEKICRVFSEPALVSKLSENGKSAALIRHNNETNSFRLAEIYNDIKNNRLMQKSNTLKTNRG